MAKRLGVDARVARQMLQIGIMCARLQRCEESERIIRAVKAFRDDVPLPGTALALTLLFQERRQEAIQELRAVLSAYPDHQVGKALLGLAYREAGQGGWERLLQEVIDDGRDEWAIKFVRESLAFDSLQPVGAGREAVPRPSPNMYA